MTTAKNQTLKARIDALRMRHEALDMSIRDEQRRPLPETTRLRSLKARKLILKDELSYYEGVLATIGREISGDQMRRAN